MISGGLSEVNGAYRTYADCRFIYCLQACSRHLYMYSKYTISLTLKTIKLQSISGGFFFFAISSCSNTKVTSYVLDHVYMCVVCD